VKVPGAPLGAAAPGAAVDLFVRPEDLRVAADGAAAVAQGVVVAQVYQGGHVDLHVETADAVSGRALLRLPGRAAMARWPLGAPIGIALAADEAVAFPTAKQMIPSS
jgi:putative spermidine/putrescine transport system ATP-binding protein